MSDNTPCQSLLLFLAMVGVSLPLAAQVQNRNFARNWTDDPTMEAIKKVVQPGPGKIAKIAGWTFLGATSLDMTTTVYDSNHPTHAYNASGQLLANYKPREVGWSGFMGNNPAVTIGANLALNAVTNLVSRRLYAKGGKERWLAIGLIGAKSYMNLSAGIGNLRQGAVVDQKIHTMTGYNGPIIWRQ